MKKLVIKKGNNENRRNCKKIVVGLIPKRIDSIMDDINILMNLFCKQIMEYLKQSLYFSKK
jgi:hypothetical protein